MEFYCLFLFYYNSKQNTELRSPGSPDNSLPYSSLQANTKPSLRDIIASENKTETAGSENIQTSSQSVVSR